jgi:hypothetical protein
LAKLEPVFNNENNEYDSVFRRAMANITHTCIKVKLFCGYLQKLPIDKTGIALCQETPFPERNGVSKLGLVLGFIKYTARALRPAA